MHSIGYMLVQEALVEKLFLALCFCTWILGKIQFSLLSFYFIQFLLSRSSVTYTSRVLMYFYVTADWHPFSHFFFMAKYN